ncbi:MAG: hypothetical protein QM659_08410 [Rhodomicrobium sp.]
MLTIGGIAAAANFRFGQTLGGQSEVDALLFGAGGVALVALNFIMPGAAAGAARRGARIQQAVCIGLFAVCAAFTLTSSVGFSSSHRADYAGDRAQAAERFERAKADVARLEGDLATMKASAKYQDSAGCADVRSWQREFCAAVSAKEAEMARTKAVMSAGRPAAIDAQAETLAALMGYKSQDVSTALSVSLAVVYELVASLGFYAVAHGGPVKAARIMRLEPAPDPVSSKPVSSVQEAARLLASRPRNASRRRALPKQPKAKLAADKRSLQEA